MLFRCRRRSSPQGWKRSVGEELRDVKRPACLKRQTGACRSCGTAVCQPCRRHTELAEATDALSTSLPGECADALRPLDPTSEAINPSRQTCAPRQERSTPSHRTGAQRVKDQRQTSTLWTEPRTEALASTPSIRPALVAEDQRQTPHCQHSLLGKARATGITHPGFYGRKPWRKPNSGVIITDPRRQKDLMHTPTPRIASKFTPACAMRSITARGATTSASGSPRPVPRSRPWPAPSLYRRAPSCAS